MITRRSFVAGLTNVSDVNDHYAFIDHHARQGDLETLKQIFAEVLEPASRSRSPRWTLGAILERIVESLALTGGYENARTALELAAVADSSLEAQHQAVRFQPPAVVSRIAAAQSAAVIDALLRDLNDLETSALVLHEAVIRCKVSADSSAARNVQQRLMKCNHPLAILPLTVDELETGISLPNYGIGSSSTSLPYGPMQDVPPVASAPWEDHVPVAETTSPERARLMSAAVVNWTEHSNGKIEARTFRVNVSTSDALATILPRLGLESVKRGDATRSRGNVTPDEVFRVLFSAASDGGAYPPGRFGAYGRLLCWESLAGLSGAAAHTPPAGIAELVETCSWCLFDSPNEWFYQVAWDIGVACANPARGELTVLTATDTD